MTDPGAPGTRYGHRVIVATVGRDSQHHKLVQVRCDCGIEDIVVLTSLQAGRAQCCRACRDKLPKGDCRPKRRQPPMLRTCTNPDGRRPCHEQRCAMWLDAHQHSCAHDVALEGPHTLAEIGELLGVSRELVRRYEVSALARMAASADAIRLHLDGFELGKSWHASTGRMVQRRMG